MNYGPNWSDRNYKPTTASNQAGTAETDYGRGTPCEAGCTWVAKDAAACGAVWTAHGRATHGPTHLECSGGRSQQDE